MNKKGPKRPAVYTDKTWLQTHYTAHKQHDEVKGASVNKSASQRAKVSHLMGRGAS
jgi:hypothetical protein